MAQPSRLAFIVALRDADDAAGLARLLDDVQLPERLAVFSAPAVRGSELFSAESGHSGGFSQDVPPGATLVYLLDHEPGLPELLRGVSGTFYVGVPEASVAAEYADAIRTFVARGPLDYATVIMRDYCHPATGHGAVFDEGEAMRMAALSADFPINLEEDFQVPAPVVDSVMIGSERFYGRADEQRKFRQLLGDMIATPPETATKIDTSYVFLIYGIGGMGKTTLCTRLFDIAREEDEFRARIRVATLDWDNQKAAAEDLKAVMETGDTALGLLSLVASSFGDSSRRFFGSFHRLIGQIREAEGRASKQLRRGGEEFSALSKIGIAGAKLLVASTVPPPLAAAINVTADQLPALATQAKAWLDRVRPEDRKLMLDGDRLLIDAFAADIRVASRERPIVVMLDTYEIVSWADERWLRSVYEKSGPRVAWILAGRFTDKQRRFYKVHWPNQRLTMSGLGQLNEYETEAYFNDTAPERPIDPGAIGLLLEATGGIPLAVYLAANMWRGGATLELITGYGDTDDLLDDELVQDMVERFLKYAREDPSRPEDYDRLCSLALLPDRLDKPDDEDADLLAVLWGVERVGLILAELEARYEFVVPRRMRLHDEVRETLRRHLMNAVPRRDLRARNRPAIGHLADRLADRQGQLATLEARCQDEEWKKNVLALSWHRFWDSYETGWATVVSALPAAIAFDTEFGNALLDQSGRFAVSATQLQRRRLEVIRESLSAYSYLTTRTSEQALAELARPQRDAGVQPDDGCADQRAGILAWQKALNLIEAGNLTEALRYLESAALSLPDDSIVLRESFTRDLEREALTLVWSETDRWYRPSEQGLEMARLATKVYPDDCDSWRTFAMALWGMHHYGDAIAAHTKAAQLYANPETYAELGTALFCMARYSESLTAFDRAIEHQRSPKYLRSRGFVLGRLGRKEEALLVFEQVIAEVVTENPEYAIAYSNVANTLLDLGKLDQAEAAALKAVQLAPERALGWLIAGLVAMYQGQADTATERFAAVLDSSNSPPGTSLFGREMQTALALSCTGQGDKAIDVLRRALPERLPCDEPPTAILKLLARCQPPPARFDEVREILVGTTDI